MQTAFSSPEVRAEGAPGDHPHRPPRKRPSRWTSWSGRPDTRWGLRRAPQGSDQHAPLRCSHRKPGTAQISERMRRFARRVRLAVVSDRTGKSLGGLIDGAVVRGTLIVTDDWSGYADLRTRRYNARAQGDRPSLPARCRIVARLAGKPVSPVTGCKVASPLIDHSAGIARASRPPTRTGSTRIARPVASSVSTNTPHTVASPSAGARRSPGIFRQNRVTAPSFAMPITLS